MEANHKKVLKAVVLELRHMLEGYYDGSRWHAGDLEQRLNAVGVWRDRDPLPADELAGLSPADINARKVADAYLALRDEAGVGREEAVAEFVRETAYTWTNRLLALRCMEVRELIDEVILQKEVYGGRSLEHNRLAQRHPELCASEDDGLFAALEAAFSKQAEHLQLLFDPKAPGVALKPGVAALKRTIALLSGTEAVRGQDPVTSDVFRAADAFGWAYQYYQQEEKERVDNWLKSKTGFKCEGADLASKTALYTEPYMVKFLVQNSLGATWAKLHPDTKLKADWEYFVKGAERADVDRKRVQEITFLDPSCGSGHFLLEAFDLFYAMYEEEGEITDPQEICRSILEHNVFGIDIDQRAVQISEATLWMKAAEKVLQETGSMAFVAIPANLVPTNIRLPRGTDHLKVFLDKYPEDKDLSSSLEIVFSGLQNADELGSLLQIEGPVEAKLKQLQQEQEQLRRTGGVQTNLYNATPIQGQLPVGIDSHDEWKYHALARLKRHFAAEAEATDSPEGFFSRSVGRGLRLLDVLGKRYDVVATNPPYLGSSSLGSTVKDYVFGRYAAAKADLYSAFIKRCLELCNGDGRVAMITQQSWMYLRSFAQLRSSSPDSKAEFSGLLRGTKVEVLAHLGPGAFGEIGGEVVNSVMFVLSLQEPDEKHRLMACQLTDVDSPEGKAALLREFAGTRADGRIYNPVQMSLLTVPDAPLVYQLSDEFSRLLNMGANLGSIADVKPGPQTSDNSRFNRLFWEIGGDGGERWFRLSKGGGFKRWTGLNYLVIDWEADGARVKEFNQRTGDHWSRNVRNVSYIFREGITYSAFASAFSARILSRSEICDTKGPGIYVSESKRLQLLAVLNTHLTQYLLKLLSPALDFNPRNIAKLPIPDQLPDNVLAEYVLQLKGVLTAGEIDEYSFSGTLLQPMERHAISSLICVAEDCIENQTASALDLSEASRKAVLRHTGPLAASLPLVEGYDSMPTGIEFGSSGHLIQALARSNRIKMDSESLNLLKREVQATYELENDRRPIVAEQDEIDESDTDHNGEDLRTGTVPTESFVEELAVRLNVHPVSIYWILKEGIETCGWRSTAEQRRFVEDRLTVRILFLLGYRWPQQTEIAERNVSWADADGIIPLTEGTAPRLIEQARVCIAAEGDLTAVEHEIAENIGVPVDQWVIHEFFKLHVRQFKKRPIAWQIQSGAFNGRRKPAFMLLVYYHKISAQTLTTIQSQHIRPLRQRYETEMRSIESVLQNARSDRQQDRMRELMDLIDELRGCDEILDSVSRTGFGPAKLLRQLRQFAIDDAMLCMKSQWLDKLSATIHTGPEEQWQQAAKHTKLHGGLARWIGEAMATLRYHCSRVGSEAPRGETLPNDPTETDLASLISKDANNMVIGALELACLVWWKRLDDAVFAPLRAEIKEAKDELKQLKEEDITKASDPHVRRKEIAVHTKRLKESVKGWQSELDEKTAMADKLKKEILAWSCPEARTWEGWLASQAMYDAISGLDGIRQPPQTVADFVSQESAYAPDINDGVRVNIAPLQKAGLLATDVLAVRDVDEAIADRAEWRADERRWCREGKLPQPGWWLTEKGHASGQD